MGVVSHRVLLWPLVNQIIDDVQLFFFLQGSAFPVVGQGSLQQSMQGSSSNQLPQRQQSSLDERKPSAVLSSYLKPALSSAVQPAAVPSSDTAGIQKVYNELVYGVFGHIMIRLWVSFFLLNCSHRVQSVLQQYSLLLLAFFVHLGPLPQQVINCLILDSFLSFLPC